MVKTLTATPEHPFFVAGRGFVALAELGVGDSIVTRAGPGLTVKSVNKVEAGKLGKSGAGGGYGTPVFNFAVEDSNTYFVTSSNSTVNGGAVQGGAMDLTAFFE